MINIFPVLKLLHENYEIIFYDLIISFIILKFVNVNKNEDDKIDAFHRCFT